jgi:hypothetical protein
MEISYTLMQNEVKVEMMYFFANSKTPTDHFVLLLIFTHLNLFKSKNCQQKKRLILFKKSCTVVFVSF